MDQMTAASDGGSDIAPEFLRQEMSTQLIDKEDLDPKRDRWSSRQFQRRSRGGLPILAICRGIQVLNVALAHSQLDFRHRLPEQKEQDIQLLLTTARRSIDSKT